MKTKLLYLTNPSCLSADGLVISSGNDEHGRYLVFDQTPAYPQGGGQESDQGYIAINGENYSYKKVKWVYEELRHYMEEETVFGGVADSAIIHVDKKLRQQNSILHTAGHLIANLVSELYPNLTPIKGHHYLSGSYVEFEGVVTQAAELVKSELEQAIKKELKSSKKIAISDDIVGYEEQNPKQGRLVTIESFLGIPCGGTHVEWLSEIPGLTVLKVRAKKGQLKINYSCEYESN